MRRARVNELRPVLGRPERVVDRPSAWTRRIELLRRQRAVLQLVGAGRRG